MGEDRRMIFLSPSFLFIWNNHVETYHIELNILYNKILVPINECVTLVKRMWTETNGMIMFLYVG